MCVCVCVCACVWLRRGHVWGSDWVRSGTLSDHEDHANFWLNKGGFQSLHVVWPQATNSPHCLTILHADCRPRPWFLSKLWHICTAHTEPPVVAKIWQCLRRKRGKKKGGDWGEPMHCRTQKRIETHLWCREANGAESMSYQIRWHFSYRNSRQHEWPHCVAKRDDGYRHDMVDIPWISQHMGVRGVTLRNRWDDIVDAIWHCDLTFAIDFDIYGPTFSIRHLQSGSQQHKRHYGFLKKKKQ